MDSMIKIDEYKQYKRAKILVSDLEKIIRIINLSISALHHFSKYAPVNQIISTLQTNKTILEIHLNKYKKIVENKGVIKTEDNNNG